MTGCGMCDTKPSDEHERNYFCIVANGEAFDVDGYAKSSPLKLDRVWRRGEKRVDSDTVHELSGLEIDLGEGINLSIEEQQEIAVESLSANERLLKTLQSTPGVTTFYLGLQENVLPDSLGSIMDVSRSLMKVALKIGIQVTIWACVDRRPQ